MLGRLGAEMDEVLHLRAMMGTCSEGDGHRRAEHDARRGGHEGMCREPDDLRLLVTAINGQVDPLCRQMEALGGAREDSGDGYRLRRRLEEGPFGSGRDPIIAVVFTGTGPGLVTCGRPQS